MMPLVLCYNLPLQQTAMLHGICQDFGCSIYPVTPDEYGRRLGDLIGSSDGACPIEDGDPFEEPMLVLAGLSNAQVNGVLQTLQDNGILIYLKALLTETNVAWSSYTLYAHICEEWAELRRQLEQHKKQQR
ncbi:MAG: DUF3783 domain-containing protein [Candidatus Limivicinus sp.]|nr:DUF3783 domain-containing protein [Clostridiales bacterium]MDY3859605.1 DUF3783 domain-containing protein [Candidatus Limivicinus sp.]